MTRSNSFLHAHAQGGDRVGGEFWSRVGLPLSLASCTLPAFSRVLPFLSLIQKGKERSKFFTPHSPRVGNANREAKQKGLRQIAKMRRTRGAESD